MIQPGSTRMNNSDTATQLQNSTRFLPFRGVANFRDLGGYQSGDGRTLSWRKLYRSGHLSRSTSSDRQSLVKLDIQTLVDFRSDQEVEREPDNLPEETDIQVIRLPIQKDGMPPLAGEIRQLISSRRLDGLDPGRKMEEMYTLLATRYSPEYRAFFNLLLEQQGSPILWHCSAGKDRAGFAAAVLLKLLGVDEETIYSDYLLSRGNVSPRRRQLLMVTLFRGRKAARFLRKMNDVESDWLSAAFQTINQHWGSFDLYRRDALGLTDTKVKTLQELYLT